MSCMSTMFTLCFVVFVFVVVVVVVAGYKGNLSENTVPLIVSVLLGIAVLFIELFILLWQTYV